MDFEIFIFILPLLLKGLHQDYSDISELFWDAKKRNFVSGKTTKIHGCKNVGHFTQLLQYIL